ncbi:hypothetical protein ACFYO2_32690 [Streptomyces sp. NPDC006602]|uniref:hypothetical protein n=1 Tax=Streptomyces sp. NPDC006602 TaxID=3364751 RepID=UPI00367BFF0C
MGYCIGHARGDQAAVRSEPTSVAAIPLGALLGGALADVLGGAMGPGAGTGTGLVLTGLTAVAAAVLFCSDLRLVRDIPGVDEDGPGVAA